MEEKIKARQIAVIGLGRFGSNVARSLSRKGADILVLDKDMDIINHAITFTQRALQLDATDQSALEATGIGNYDVVCVCVGNIRTASR
jgi:trk system potassium uptake protein TrkA